MRHDYDLPPDWEAMDSDEKSKWMTQDRAKRQAMRQSTASAKEIEDGEERRDRRVSARNETVSLEEKR